MTQRDLYVQGPGLGLAISGGPMQRGYFRREYREVASNTVAGPPPILEACLSRLAGPRLDPLVEGRYKLARWRVRVRIQGDAAVEVRAQVRGPFGLPLVQSLIIEPLIGVAAARQGFVLVPGALLLDGEGQGVLLVGGSGAGKTSLAARAIAAGRHVLADDRVFLDAQRTASRFARRMRLYPDLGETAPRAWHALARGPRARLHAAAMARTLSGGRLAPPVAVAQRDLGALRPLSCTPVSRILVLGRHEGSTSQLSAVSSAAATDEMQQRVRDDRAALDGVGLSDELRQLANRERGLLESAIPAAVIERLDIPLAWPAARSVERLAAELGIP